MCNTYEAIYKAIEELTTDEGDSVTIFSANPEEFDASKQRTVYVSGGWNEYSDELFYGATFAAALNLAVCGKRKAMTPSDTQ